MSYDVTIPIKIGLFTLAVSFLVVYFLLLAVHLANNKHNPRVIAFVVFSMAVMLSGLLLTGYAEWLQ